MTYSYRKASRTEKEAIFELYRVVMSAYMSTIWDWNETWQENDFATHFNPEGITLVYKANELVGYSHVENNNDQLYLRMIAIHPNYQRKGIGRKLLESFISSGKEQSKSVGLEVFKLNTEAKRFYEGHGFKVEGETLNSYIMSLNA
ncbi:MAG: GNAT family N-acetyltransferase [Methylobacter sp.]